MEIGNNNNQKKGISLAHLSNRQNANTQTNNKGNNSTIWFVIVAAVIVGVFVYNQNKSSQTANSTYTNTNIDPDRQNTNNHSGSNRTKHTTNIQTQPKTTEMCPMCNGTGIFEYMTDDIIAPKEKCSGCNGTGWCDSETAQNLREMQQNINNMFGVGNQSNSGGTVNLGQRTCTQCNGTGLVVVDETHPDHIGLGLHPHEYVSPDPGCTIIHCRVCGKNHCSELTRHANCTACNGTGKR